jgi:adenylate cyclase
MIDLFNLDQATQGKTEIKIGIGIASGSVIAGYTGTSQRATYTCVGDTVNLGSRLESHTKVIGKPILVDEETRKALGEDFKLEHHGPVIFKGKTHPIEVFSLVSKVD